MRVVPVVLLLVLLVPTAIGARATFGSEHAAQLDGSFRAVFPGGQASLRSTAGEGEYELRDVEGVASIYTWRAAGSSLLNFTQPAEDASPRRVPLHDATIRGVLASEWTKIVVLAGEGGSVAIAGGPPEKPARPMWFDAAWPVDTPAAGFRGAPELDWGAEPGWAGIQREIDREAGPFPSQARLEAYGPFRIELNGGNVTLLHANGTSELVRLSPVLDAEAGPGRLERQTRMILDVSSGLVSLPLPNRWSFLGPEVRWEVDGAADWPRAAGDADGVPFEGALHAEGRMGIIPSPPDAGIAGEDRYQLDGDNVFLAVDGVPISVVEKAGPSLPDARWTLVGALAAVAGYLASPFFAGRAFAPFYTRIARDDLTTHPMRSRICHELRARPGIHLRDLHRTIGGAWGTFSFHLGMLSQAGIVRFHRDGRYVVTYLAHQGTPRSLPRHATARRIYEALPTDGTPVTIPHLRESLGLSRQLVDHHVMALEEQGLVEVRSERPRRVIRRSS